MHANPLRTHRRSLFLALLIFLSAVHGAAAAVADESFIAETGELLSRLERLGFAGVVLVARDGLPLLARGYGLADRELGITWSPGMVSTIGSITKQFTGAAILALAEEGRLSVHDPIGRYIDGVPADKAGITLHHLLTHSSGIVDLEGADDWDPIERAEFVRRILDQPLAFTPGERYEYTNAGYSLLGAIIEQLTGGSYEQFLRRRLLAPHGLYETGYVLPAWGEARMAQGYLDDGERWGTVLERPLAGDGPYWVLRANGGLHTTAYDMLRWAEALRAGRVLGPESMAALWTPHVSEGGDTDYGYGWSIMTVGEGTKVVTHNGGNGIHFADLAIVPDAGLVIFLQTNVADAVPEVGNLLPWIGYRLLAGEPYPEVPDVVEAPSDTLAAVTGEYALAGGTLRVTTDGAVLRLEPWGAEIFTRLHSEVPVDLERAARLSQRIDAVVGAFRAGDLQPLWQAYGADTPLERLERTWSERRRTWEEENGALTGHQVVGTALGRRYDRTVVRLLFERGTVERTLVWDAAAEEHLLGVSRRGFDPVMRFHPVRGGGFASWDGRTASSRPLTFEADPEGGSLLRLGDGETDLRARKAADRNGVP